MSTVNILQQQVETCPATGYQAASVCVPVTVRPFARNGNTVTFCCGAPVVTPGVIECPGVVNGSCTFTITQNICTAVPVEFGARARVGNLYVLCGETSNEDICTGCNDLI